jgi:hypothetical protein
MQRYPAEPLVLCLGPGASRGYWADQQPLAETGPGRTPDDQGQGKGHG